ncbi:hypothetical protein RRSWK_04196 [Rhodopirellula sp. SWK7]|nr:hypothetical protein RRSWK_04196 [Rhodopirellula sp. SWK7]
MHPTQLKVQRKPTHKENNAMTDSLHKDVERPSSIQQIQTAPP